MARPFIRQLGGKGYLLDEILSRYPPPDAWDALGVPFVGGGADVFGAEERGMLAGKLVVLGDADPWLIRCYVDVRDEPERLYRRTHRLVSGIELLPARDRAGYYKTIRTIWDTGARSTAYALFLRSSSWNAMWRESRAGNMNVGFRGKPRMPTLEEMLACQAALQGVELLDWDFRDWEVASPDGPGRGDGSIQIGHRWVMVLDPPYIGGFVNYLAAGFTMDDQRDVVVMARTWQHRGAHIIYSQAGVPEAYALLAEHWPEAEVHTVMVPRHVNSDPNGRGPVPEILAVGKPR